MDRFKSLKFFMLKSQAYKLARDCFKTAAKIEDPQLREEIRGMIRTGFLETRNIEDETKLEIVLHNGIVQLDQLKKHLEMCQA
jgi:Complex 1 protein (LYR family)